MAREGQAKVSWPLVAANWASTADLHMHFIKYSASMYMESYLQTLQQGKAFMSFWQTCMEPGQLKEFNGSLSYGVCQISQAACLRL